MTDTRMPGGKHLPGSGEVSPVVRLGTDIARQFESWPNRDKAAEEIATHIKKFWEPRMRRELLARVRVGDTSLPLLLGMAAAHLVDDEINYPELAEPSGG